MKPYIHRVAYYETDRMGITHHSNYVRWMEEARIDFLDQLGWGFAGLEARGVTSPVLSAACSYRKTTTFDDRVSITVEVASYNGARLGFSYTMRLVEADGRPGAVVCTGTTEHCFLGGSGRPVRVARELPGLDAALKSQLEAEAHDRG